MGLRLGVGVRLSRHVGLFYSVPLGHHARALGRHRGHGSGDPVQMMVGAVFLYVFCRVAWGLAWGP
jgi:hypothetical protein